MFLINEVVHWLENILKVSVWVTDMLHDHCINGALLVTVIRVVMWNWIMDIVHIICIISFFWFVLRSPRATASSFVSSHLISNLWGHQSFSSAPKQQLSRNRTATIWLRLKKTFFPNHLQGILLLWFTSSKAIGSFSSQTWAQRFSDHLWSMRSWYLWMESKCIQDVQTLRVGGKIHPKLRSGEENMLSRQQWESRCPSSSAPSALNVQGSYQIWQHINEWM